MPAVRIGIDREEKRKANERRTKSWQKVACPLFCVSPFLCIPFSVYIFTQNGTAGLRNFKNQTATVTSYGKSRPFILDLERSKIDYGERDFGLAYEYKCMKGTMDKKYLQLLLSVGGSCRVCEWVDLVDEDGKRIASSRGNEDERRYFSFIKKLGISKKEYSKNWMPIGVWD